MPVFIAFAAFLLLVFGHRFGLPIRSWVVSGEPFGTKRKSPRQKSGVRTAALEMVLHHDSGRMEGRCLRGRFTGRDLSSLVESEQTKVNAVIYVGDCMEEDIDELSQRAGTLGLMGVPMFVFQEGRDTKAETAFKEIARLTQGAYCHFDAGSARQLRDLLAAVAVYASGGRKALRDYGEATKSAAAVRLLDQLR